MKRTIYMSEPLERLAEETRGDSRRTSGFSRRLGEIVERYQIMIDFDAETLPDLTETELSIMGEVLSGAVIDRRKVRGLHLDVLDAAVGSDDDRKQLSKKIEALTAGQRLALVEKYGYWTVLKVDDPEHPGKVLCRCICGREKWLFRSPLRCGKTKSCGCQAHKQSDFGLHPGDRVGYWTILKQCKDYFLCRCVCGREKWVYAHNLVKGLSLSCGCKRTDGDSPALVDGRKISVAVRKKHLDTKYAGFGRKENKNNTAGVTGVSFAKDGQYRAYIYVNRKQIHLGVFDTLEEAAKARRVAEIKYFKPRQKRANEIKEKMKKNKQAGT